MSRPNAPENFFSAVRGCPRPCARTNPWFRGQIFGEKCAQEPTPGSAVKHCRFLDTGGGGYPPPPPCPCRLLGLSPMVQPARRRRCKSSTPSTEGSSGTLDSGHHSDSPSLSSSHEP